MISMCWFVSSNTLLQAEGLVALDPGEARAAKGRESRRKRNSRRRKETHATVGDEDLPEGLVGPAETTERVDTRGRCAGRVRPRRPANAVTWDEVRVSEDEWGPRRRGKHSLGSREGVRIHRSFCLLQVVSRRGHGWKQEARRRETRSKGNPSQQL